MKKWMEQFRVEDWVVVWVSIPLLALAAIVPELIDDAAQIGLAADDDFTLCKSDEIGRASCRERVSSPV